jgi:hypothetical protein
MASAKTCRALVAVITSLTLWVGSARAQISGASVNNAGSTCSGSNGDGFCGSSTQTLTNNGTTLATRYAWNVNADVGALSTRDETGSAQHHVSFTATAPGGYRLNISTSRAGMVQRNSDVLNCEGQAHISSITGSSNIALASGSLSISPGLDIGNGTGNNQQTLSGSSAAVINRVSNGVGQSHSLTFTWSGSVRSNSCEAAVRMGQQNGSTSGCAACEYPGSPSRTQSSDGHFVTVTYTSLCGNHVIDAAVSEACDEGSANGTFTSCCNSNCTLKSGGTTCRSSAGPCDVAENCTGSSPTCPADGFASTSTVCRAAGGVCDIAENCTGSSPGCPFDFKQPNGTECRASAGVCDPAEVCNGSSNTCPANSFSPSTTVCRASAGVCDVAETCTGGSATCPANGFQSSSTVCRASSGVCDVAESCTGGSAACPADAVQSTASVCRPAAGVCDQAESCDGVTKNCPNDSAAGAFVVCRPAAGVCDQAETCDGVNNDCPADAKKTTLCRAAAGVCDLAEVCDGVNNACPADAKKTTQCRASAGVCDVAEFCDGTNNACPANGFASSTTVCRASAGVCDVDENCTGSSAACPADGFEPSTTVCRGASDVCDVAENCTGGSAACPADAVASTATVCRPAAGTCDVAEFCDGSGKACPSDSVVGAFVTCRPAAGVCDQVENCDGVNVDCPADAKKTTQCRAAADVCDVAETCNGTDDDCPADGFAPSTTECRAAAGACDVSENCTGGSAACPADAFAPSTQECRSDTGQCDVAENCTGSSAACPPDGFEPDNTPCDDGNACVVGEACEGGVCTGGVGEVCNACETCIPGTGCEAVPRNDCFLSTEPFRSKLLIKDATPDTIDKVIWKWIRGETVTLADFGDPLATDDYAFCLFDATGLMMQAAMPAGGTCGTKPCWKALNGKGYKYVDSTGTPDGINKLLLKAGGAGLSKVIMKGKGDNLLMPTLPLTLNVQAEIRSSNGQCWSTIHTATGTVRNDSTQFKSKDGN